MDYKQLISTKEDDFINLVNYAASGECFHYSAQRMLGDNYKSLGEEIVKKEEDKSLEEKFLSYFN
jgi:hypothetical protein